MKLTTGKFILNERGEPIPEPDLFKWARWFESATNRVVAQDLVGPYRVSTVFLGLDHNYSGGEPILWESMIFKDGKEIEQRRASGSREQAQAMHAEMVQVAKSKLPS